MSLTCSCVPCSVQQLHCQQAQALRQLPQSSLAPELASTEEELSKSPLHGFESGFDTAKLREAAAAALNRELEPAGGTAQPLWRMDTSKPGRHSTDASKDQLDQAVMDARAAARALRVRVQKQGSSASSLGNGSPGSELGLAAAGVAPHAASRLAAVHQTGSPQTIPAAYPGLVDSQAHVSATAVDAGKDMRSAPAGDLHPAGPQKPASLAGRARLGTTGPDPSMRANLDRLNAILKSVAAMRQPQQAHASNLLPAAAGPVAECKELPSASEARDATGSDGYVSAALAAQARLLMHGHSRLPQEARAELPAWLLAGQSCPCVTAAPGQCDAEQAQECAYHMHTNPCAYNSMYSNPCFDEHACGPASRPIAEAREGTAFPTPELATGRQGTAVKWPSPSSPLRPGAGSAAAPSPSIAGNKLGTRADMTGTGILMDKHSLTGYRPLEDGLGTMAGLRLPHDVPPDLWKSLAGRSRAGQAPCTEPSAWLAAHIPLLLMFALAC